MTLDKKPFHEVLADLMVTAPDGMMSKIKRVRAEQLNLLLDILYRSNDIPAAAAHTIARDNAGLPMLLVDAGLISLSEKTIDVLADLKNRSDDAPAEPGKKPPLCFKCLSVTYLRAENCPGDPDVLKDFPYGCPNGCVPAFAAQLHGLLGQVYEEQK